MELKCTQDFRVVTDAPAQGVLWLKVDLTWGVWFLKYPSALLDLFLVL